VEAVNAPVTVPEAYCIIVLGSFLLHPCARMALLNSSRIAPCCGRTQETQSCLGRRIRDGQKASFTILHRPIDSTTFECFHCHSTRHATCSVPPRAVLKHYALSYMSQFSTHLDRTLHLTTTNLAPLDLAKYPDARPASPI
jgi:hypothetical protein